MIQSLTDLVTNDVALAYALIFLTSLGEALFVVGIFVPSTVVLLAAGALAGGGQLPFWPVVALASAGAILGDAASFWFGRRHREGIRLLWPFRRFESLLDRGEAFFDRHGGKSILVGRFVPGIKTVVPVIAGMAGMDVVRFGVVNVVSAVVWALAHILPGAGLARGLAAYGGFDARMVVAAGIVLLLLALLYHAFVLAWRTVAPPLARWRTRRLAKVGAGTGWPSRLLRRILSTDANLVGRSLVGLVAAVAVGVFATLVADLLFDPELRAADQAVFNYLQSVRTDAGMHVVTAVTMAADGFVLTGLTLVVLAWLASRRRFGLACVFAGATGATSLFVPAIKSIIQRPRPTALYSGAESFSFPSGHATQSSVFLGILAVILASNLPPRHRPKVFAAAAVGAMCVAFTRLYLGAHWLSDVAAGLSFGTLVTTVFAASTWRVDRSVRARSLAFLLAASFLPLYTVHMARSYDTWLAAYAPSPSRPSLTQAEWLAGGWRSVGDRRMTLGGDEAGRLVVQTDLPPDALAERLAGLGWSRVAVGGVMDTIVPTTAPLAERPASPLLHDGRPARQAFARYGSDRNEREVVTFWPAFAEASGGSGEILVGAVSRETLDPIVGGYATVDVHERNADPAAIGLAAGPTPPGGPGVRSAVALWPTHGSPLTVEAAR